MCDRNPQLFGRSPEIVDRDRHEANAYTKAAKWCVHVTMSTDTTSSSRSASLTVANRLGKELRSKTGLGTVFGFVLIGIGMLLQEGVIAGMMGIYGATAIVLSVVARVVLIRLRRVD